jgi:asparagine synthase (glutamine-hydrolysing)
MSWGLEARFPFLDLDWLELAYSLDPTSKMSTTHPEGKRIEKHVLRSAFDDKVRLFLLYVARLQKPLHISAC